MVDSVIKIFESNPFNNDSDFFKDLTIAQAKAKASMIFDTNGIGWLPDALTCVVTEERNGSFELEMTYPVNGRRYSDIKLRRIIVTRPNKYSRPQPFRIYSITSPIGGVVTINAEHISYDLSGYPVSDIHVSNAKDATDVINGKIDDLSELNPIYFEFDTSLDSSFVGDFSFLEPRSIRSIMGGSDETLLEIYGGEYEFDRYKVYLHQNRGMDRGVSIRYGKNLTDLTQEQNCNNVYTGVYPYWYTEEDGMIVLDEKIVKTSGTFDYDRILVLDVTSEFTDMPTQDEIRQYTIKYIEQNNIGTPEVSIDISFEQLSQFEEYSDYAMLEDVRLCDIVHVEFESMNVKASAKCIKMEYDVLSKQYKSISLGESQTTLVDSMSAQSTALLESPTQSELEKAIARSTKIITGGTGGEVILSSSSNATKPDELIILSESNPNWRTDPNAKMWRFNKNGLGFSNSGYNGVFETALTFDGYLVAERIDSGTINSDLTVAGSMRTRKGNVLINDKGLRIHNNGANNIGNVGDDQMAVAYSDELVMAINEDTSYFKKIAIGPENSNYELMASKPDDWEQNWSKYYISSGDGSYKSIPKNPNWVSGKYYSKVDDNYVVLTQKPDNWETNYYEYYMQSERCGDGYSEVSYIESSNGSSFFDTEYYADNETGLYLKYEITPQYTLDSSIAGSFDNYIMRIRIGNTDITEEGLVKLQLFSDFGVTSSYDAPQLVGINEPFQYYLNWKNNRKRRFNDMIVGDEVSAISGPMASSIKIYSDQTGGTNTTGRLYFMMVSQNDNVVHNYVPCVSDNKVFLYDLNENKVVEPSSQSGLSYGPRVYFNVNDRTQAPEWAPDRYYRQGLKEIETKAIITSNKDGVYIITTD